MNAEPPERNFNSTSTPRMRPSLLLAILLSGVLLVATAQADSTLPTNPGLHALPNQPFLSSLGLLILIIANAIFAGAEAAIDHLRPVHIKFLREKGSSKADKLEKFLSTQANAVAACNLASHFVRLLLVIPVLLLAPGISMAISSIGRFDGTHYAAILLCALLLFVFPVGPLVLLAEQAMRVYAVAHPHRAVSRLAPAISVARILFAGPAKLALEISNMLSRRIEDTTPKLENTAEEEIRTIVETAEVGGDLEEEEKEMIHSVFEFNDTVVREIMTPRVDLDAMPVDSSPEDILKLIKQSGHSRIPLYEGSDDSIVGVVHAKELLTSMLEKENINLRMIMRPALFVPENKDLHELLEEMRRNRTELAIVQDEFGGTAGIVTSEDIVEELVGDIVDEYDHEEPTIVETPEGWTVDGKVHLDDLNHEIGTTLESEEFDTVGGYVFGHFGRQPRQGEQVEIDNWAFEVAKTDGRRILQLYIRKRENMEDANSEGTVNSEMSS